MDWIKALTPKKTEEVKPGLFVQETLSGHRVVHPAVWQGKIIWKNFIFGGGFWKGFIFFAILMLIVGGYYFDTQNCREFQADPCEHLVNLTIHCGKKTEDYDVLYKSKTYDLLNLTGGEEEDDGKTNTYSLQNHIE